MTMSPREYGDFSVAIKPLHPLLRRRYHSALEELELYLERVSFTACKAGPPEGIEQMQRMQQMQQESKQASQDIMAYKSWGTPVVQLPKGVNVNVT